MKRGTYWYKLNEEEKRWEFNHMQPGRHIGDYPKPVVSPGEDGYEDQLKWRNHNWKWVQKRR